jgi:hypothetical protein
MARPNTTNRNEAPPEFPLLHRLLTCYYHQDVWLDHSSHEEVWQEFFADTVSAAPGQLMSEVNLLLAKDTAEIRKFIGIYADGLAFRRSREYRSWASKLATWLSTQTVPDKSAEQTLGG